MWFNDVSKEPWCIKHATSLDGKKWRVTTDPVLEIDQEWESGRLFYPTVLKIDDVYLMWYGSYWTGRKNTTALGFAVSVDGLNWYRTPGQPGTQTGSRTSLGITLCHQPISHGSFPDGSFRIWYARRKKPPFVNKYFAINTAHWSGPANENSLTPKLQKKPARVCRTGKTRAGRN